MASHKIDNLIEILGLYSEDSLVVRAVLHGITLSSETWTDPRILDVCDRLLGSQGPVQQPIDVIVDILNIMTRYAHDLNRMPTHLFDVCTEEMALPLWTVIGKVNHTLSKGIAVRATDALAAFSHRPDIVSAVWVAITRHVNEPNTKINRAAVLASRCEATAECAAQYIAACGDHATITNSIDVLMDNVYMIRHHVQRVIETVPSLVSNPALVSAVCDSLYRNPTTTPLWSVVWTLPIQPELAERLTPTLERAIASCVDTELLIVLWGTVYVFKQHHLMLDLHAYENIETTLIDGLNEPDLVEMLWCVAGKDNFEDPVDMAVRTLEIYSNDQSISQQVLQCISVADARLVPCLVSVIDFEPGEELLDLAWSLTRGFGTVDSDDLVQLAAEVVCGVRDDRSMTVRESAWSVLQRSSSDVRLDTSVVRLDTDNERVLEMAWAVLALNCNDALTGDQFVQAAEHTLATSNDPDTIVNVIGLVQNLDPMLILDVLRRVEDYDHSVAMAVAGVVSHGVHELETVLILLERVRDQSLWDMVHILPGYDREIIGRLCDLIVQHVRGDYRKRILVVICEMANSYGALMNSVSRVVGELMLESGGTDADTFRAVWALSRDPSNKSILDSVIMF